MAFKLTILGSNSALPTSKRFPTAHVLQVHEQFFLIDCGEGTQIQIRKYKLSFNKIRYIFISHLHGDHYFGLFGLISTFSLLGRKAPLNIIGPPDLQEIINFQLKFLEKEFEIIYTTTIPNKSSLVLDNKTLTVTAFPLKHRIPTHGFLFREKIPLKNIRKEAIGEYNISLKHILSIKEGNDYIQSDGSIIKNERLTLPSYIPRSYAFCSDTGFHEPIIEMIKDVDLLYHEATYLSQLDDLALIVYHSTAAQAATIAAKARVKKLLIGHFSARYNGTKEFLDEAKPIFENTFAVEDGDQFEVEKTREI